MALNLLTQDIGQHVFYGVECICKSVLSLEPGDRVVLAPHSKAEWPRDRHVSGLSAVPAFVKMTYTNHPYFASLLNWSVRDQIAALKSEMAAPTLSSGTSSSSSSRQSLIMVEYTTKLAECGVPSPFVVTCDPWYPDIADVTDYCHIPLQNE